MNTVLKNHIRASALATLGGIVLSLTPLTAQCTLAWSPLGTPNDSVLAIAPLPDGGIVAAGRFTTIGGIAANRVARFDAMTSTWSAMGNGLNDAVFDLTVAPNGDVYAGGAFTASGATTLTGLARFDGTNWQPLGSGLTRLSGPPNVWALQALTNGDVLVGGFFDTADGVPARNIARWTGTTFQALGSGANGLVRGMHLMNNGDVLVCGDFTFTSGVNTNRIGQYDPQFGTWSSFGSGFLTSCEEVHQRPNGDIIAGGQLNFTTAPGPKGLARWTGSSWVAFGNPSSLNVRSMTSAPDGSLFIGFNNGLARYDLGLSNIVALQGSASSLATRTDGSIAIGGFFTAPGAAQLAILGPTCPATATSYGSACPSSTGSNTLEPASTPWIGGFASTKISSLPPGSLAVAVVGNGSASTALSTLLSQAQPGCDLLATPDVLLTIVPDASGDAYWILPIANDPALGGFQLFQQMAVLEFDSNGDISSVTSSNGIEITVGVFP